MRTLEPVDLTDLIVGAAVLGTGGGGSLPRGLEILRPDIEAGRRVRLASLAELADDAWVACPYAAGAVSPGDGPGDPVVLEGPEETEALASFRALEAHVGRRFEAVITTEVGAENTADAVHVAAVLDRVLLDADPAGRSVPELQHSTFALHGVPIAPLAVATRFGDVAVLSQVGSDARAEALVRAMAVASGDEIGVTSHAASVGRLRGAVIDGAISAAVALGAALRRARERGVDAAEALALAGRGAVRFRGVLAELEWANRDGFTVGRAEFTGVGVDAGHRYRVWFKNEHLMAWRDGVVDVTVPDLICVVTGEGEPVTNPGLRSGEEYAVLALPAPAPWRTPAGLACFGPRSFGFDVDYVPAVG